MKVKIILALSGLGRESMTEFIKKNNPKEMIIRSPKKRISFLSGIFSLERLDMVLDCGDKGKNKLKIFNRFLSMVKLDECLKKKIRCWS